ncbi:MAG: hypothetical protein NC304_05450, partial [Robinsoniella sp.]|nr:hypothetical protein [Robinsoniella sp.]
MVVQHNLRAMNSNRMLGVTTKAQSKSTEKLSSGYKINRAADDAAGLAISEKMRKQIRGLTQATANAQDGISAVQTAEGALTEVHDMLQRMNELAIKAGNGTMSESDRQSIQDEVDQLVTEIDRVSETTKFNETYLLKGTGKNKNSGEASARVDGKIQEAVISKATGNIFKGTMDMDSDYKLDAGTEDTATVTYLDAEGNKRTKDVTFKTGANAKTTAANLAEAINEDKDLKKIFKATSNAAGGISVESKLDGTKTDNTKNAVQNITFESATKPDGSVGGVKRRNRFTEIDPAKDIVEADQATEAAKMVTAAKGEAYTFTIGSVKTDGSPELKLKDGESITINGKTYTYDKNKVNSAANSFASIDDLQKLIGDEYDVTVQVKGTKKVDTYEVTSTSPSEAAKQVSSVSEEFATNATADGLKKEISTLAAADFEDSPASDTIPATVTNVDAKVGTNPVVGDQKSYTTYEDLKFVLSITEKSTVDQAKDVLNFSLQVGADTTEENKISVDIESMSAKSLGILNIAVTGEDSSNADAAVNTISDAIAKVSA